MALQGISDNSIQVILSFRPRFILHTNFVDDLPTRVDVQGLVIDFVSTLKLHGFLPEPFDWQQWLESSGLTLNDPANFVAADLETLQKLILAHIRTDRFVRGHLESLVASGYFVAFLNRLELLNAGGTQTT